MIIISDRDLPLARRTVLTIGAFDGVHIGHACLLGAMRTVSAEKGLRNCVWTFAENPKSLMNGGVKYITGSMDKMEALEQLGAESVYFADFESYISASVQTAAGTPSFCGVRLRNTAYPV